MEKPETGYQDLVNRNLPQDITCSKDKLVFIRLTKI